MRNATLIFCMKGKMAKKVTYIFLIVFLLCSLSGCKHEQTEDIYILYTNDVASEVDGEVGYAGVKGLKDQMEKQYNYVALVDAGDYYDGSLSKSSDGKAIMKIMNAVGYDVVTIGNQEFSIGLDALKDDIAHSDFKYVSCNIRYTGKGFNPLRKVKPYVIKNFGGTKVAFIGVTTPETLIPNKPAYEAILDNGEPIYDFYGDNEGQDLYAQIQKTVDKVRKKVDYVILIAHLGTFGVMDGYSSYEVIGHTNGIDVVIDGHSHAIISGEPVLNKDGDQVALTSTGEKLENVGVLQIHPDHTFTTVLYPSVYEKDESIESLIQSIVSQ